MISDEWHTELQAKVEHYLRTLALPWLEKFIAIPNLSRGYDLNWDTNGLLEQACEHCLDYAKLLDVKGYEAKLYKDAGKTPIVFGTIKATKTENVKRIILYGHIDKQPHLTEGWDQGLHPTIPVTKNGKLYGRGGVDDGYNWFTVLAILKAMQDTNTPHDEYVLFFECDEETASIDIPYYIEKFKDVIQTPHALFCLDASSINNNVFSISTTLRGCCNFDIRVRVLEKSMHSGVGSGIVPSTFRIMRQLLDRIECVKTGKIIDELQVEIPEDKLHQARHAALVQGETVHNQFCFCKGVKPVSDNIEELYLNNIWRSQLEVVGQKGIPHLHESGNVLREETILRCSLRLPPTLDGPTAFKTLHEILTKDPPYGAIVEVTCQSAGNGFSANKIPEQVIEILDKHNEKIFGTKTLMYGLGGSIPFIKTLQDLLPETLLFVSGIVLPDSAIHGPNENMDLEYWYKFSRSFTCFLVDYSNLKSN